MCVTEIYGYSLSFCVSRITNQMSLMAPNAMVRRVRRIAVMILRIVRRTLSWYRETEEVRSQRSAFRYRRPEASSMFGLHALMNGEGIPTMLPHRSKTFDVR